MFETTFSKCNIPVLRVEGKLIGNTVDVLRREMEKQIEQSNGRLILDLTNVLSSQPITPTFERIHCLNDATRYYATKTSQNHLGPYY